MFQILTLRFNLNTFFLHTFCIIIHPSLYAIYSVLEKAYTIFVSFNLYQLCLYLDKN